MSTNTTIKKEIITKRRQNPDSRVDDSSVPRKKTITKSVISLNGGGNDTNKPSGTIKSLASTNKTPFSLSGLIKQARQQPSLHNTAGTTSTTSTTGSVPHEQKVRSTLNTKKYSTAEFLNPTKNNDQKTSAAPQQQQQQHSSMEDDPWEAKNMCGWGDVKKIFGIE